MTKKLEETNNFVIISQYITKRKMERYEKVK